jgi:hypothetical protein
MAIRLLTDIAPITSAFVLGHTSTPAIGFGREATKHDGRLTFDMLIAMYQGSPGLVADKLKAVLEMVWSVMKTSTPRGIVFAYDEAQNMADHAADSQYPLSLLLDVFQSLQRRGVPFILVLTGLPTLFPKLVEARTYAERMFRVLFLDRLDDVASRLAILKPIEDADCPVKLAEPAVRIIVEMSGGYPYFLQYICREAYDSVLQQLGSGTELSPVPTNEITRKLDSDFFAGRWSRATDRQRELLAVIAELDATDDEFTVQAIVEKSKTLLEKAFGSSHVNQLLNTLSAAGLVYKNRHGKYAFAVPLLAKFIKRQKLLSA